MYNAERKTSASSKRKTSKSGRSPKKAKRSSQAESSEDEGNVSFDDEQVRNYYHKSYTQSNIYILKPEISYKCHPQNLIEPE